MSDLGIWEQLAHGLIARYGKSPDRLRKQEAHFLLERTNAATPECREGFSLVLKRIREKLADFPELPLFEREP